eukprot:148048-Pleurochrysis_carterae.AAC.1
MQEVRTYQQPTMPMHRAWGKTSASSEVKSISTLSKARNNAREPPPALREARAAARREELRQKRLEQAKRKREAEAAEAAAKQ